MATPSDHSPLGGRAQGAGAARLMELLGLTEDELCQTLDSDPLTLLSGQLDHRSELPILLDLLDVAAERAGAPVLRRWVRAPTVHGRPIDALLRRDFAAFEDALDQLAERGFVLRGADKRPPVATGMGEPFVHRLRVRYAECDPQGVLFNAHYLAYIDHTITELWRAAYGGYNEMLARGVDIVVAETHMRFLGSARFDDEIAIEATVVDLGTTSVTTAYRFLRGDEVLLSATMRHVFVERDAATKTPIPDWARAGLAPWMADQQPDPVSQ